METSVLIGGVGQESHTYQSALCTKLINFFNVQIGKLDWVLIMIMSFSFLKFPKFIIKI